MKWSVNHELLLFNPAGGAVGVCLTNRATRTGPPPHKGPTDPERPTTADQQHPHPPNT